ncbi:MAG: CcmD family protein [Bacteroidetes bacterium]|nr:CcmD family protein [Bacteroidota bacterium]
MAIRNSIKRLQFHATKRAAGLALLLLVQGVLNASSAEEILRGNGKYNVVAAVLILIFCGIIFFLVRMDRRLSQLEKEKEGKL